MKLGPHASGARSEVLSEAAFLAHCVTGATLWHVYLANGIRLTGRIVAEDHDCVFMRGGDVPGALTQMIYKRQIASVAPARPTIPDRDSRSDVDGILWSEATRR
jgi:sRNA-binding regulator protein Hfq